jgi:hypothetical protein
MYRFANISSANLAATITTASSEAPGNGETLATLNTFRGPGGSYSITATYR